MVKNSVQVLFIRTLYTLGPLVCLYIMLPACRMLGCLEAYRIRARLNTTCMPYSSDRAKARLKEIHVNEVVESQDDHLGFLFLFL